MKTVFIMLGMTRTRILVPALFIAAGSLLLTACSTASSDTSGTTSQRVIRVVAAENFWGSIAAQVGGRHVQVSIITNPNADPHSYEPNAADGREIATAQLVIENGIGYDPRVSRLIAASGSQPAVINVGASLGVPAGENPHRWYNPGNVHAVITAMVAAFSRADGADRTYFRKHMRRFDSTALRPYHS
jgi:zinc/manganese transport system substrate-binding protein